MCGLHDEGLRVVEQLVAAGSDVVVVDDEPDARLVPALHDLQVDLVADDSREAATLQAAGIAEATALVCVESDDLHTLATGLLARELRPDLRVVVQLRNAAVGRALEGVGVTVIDVARVAAPSIVESCLLRVTRHMELAGAEYLVVQDIAREASTLRAAYGDLGPLGLVPSGGGPTVVAPGRDEPVAAGDSVVLVGRTESVTARGLGETQSSVPFVGARAPRVGPRRSSALGAIVRGVDRRLRLAVASLGGLVVLSVAVLMVGYREADGTRMSVVDALYFTVETIGTVGFGDFYFRDQHLWLRMWAIGLMVVGATLATVFFALLTNALIGQTIARALGSRRITDLSDHVIVIGVGSVGLAVVDELRALDVPVVVVDADEHQRFAAQLRRQDVPLVVADATLPGTLQSVGLERARAVAVLTSDDLANLESGLAVRDLLGDRWSDVPVVLRVFDPRTARTVGTSFDFRHVRSPADLAAPWFVGAALGLDVVSTLYVGNVPLLVARLTVSGGLAGLSMMELSARIRVVTIEGADGVVAEPRRDTRLALGDVAHLVGPYEEMLALLRRDRA